MPFTRESSLYNLFHKDKNYKKEAEKIRASYPKAITVLELGAGTGLLTKQLKKLGFKITIVEPSREMLDTWRQTDIDVICDKLENVPKKRFKKNQFDLTVAHYDVLNYIKEIDQCEQMDKILYWSKNVSVEKWDKKQGVKLFTYKKVDGWRRFRIAICIKNTAHVWFIYLGKGLFIEKHTLYL